jgi:DNA-binding NarL/FixJ family response regulator
VKIPNIEYLERDSASLWQKSWAICTYLRPQAAITMYMDSAIAEAKEGIVTAGGRPEHAEFGRKPSYVANLAVAEKSGLAPRELDVLCLITAGCMDSEIAGELGISTLTVNSHVKRILRKLHVERRAAAAAKAIHLGIIIEVGPPTR